MEKKTHFTEKRILQFLPPVTANQHVKEDLLI